MFQVLLSANARRIPGVAAIISRHAVYLNNAIEGTQLFPNKYRLVIQPGLFHNDMEVFVFRPHRY